MPEHKYQRQRQDDEQYLLQLHWEQAQAEYLVQRREEQGENGWVHARAIHRDGGIVDVPGIGVRAAFGDVLRMVDVHGEVVAPEMAQSHSSHMEGCDGGK